MIFTHPTIASLGHPLFACGGKRGLKKFVMRSEARKKSLFNPLSGEAEERVGKRSDAGVSLLCVFKLLRQANSSNYNARLSVIIPYLNKNRMICFSTTGNFQLTLLNIIL
jgi:hypothetical protein